TTIVAKKGRMYYTPDGHTAVLELEDGEIHDIPPDEQGAHRYRRLIFKTHIINIPGAGAILERTVRDSRTDREMSTHDLATGRDSVRTQSRTSVTQHRMRLVALGADQATIESLTPERRPWPERIGAWAGRVIGRRDEITTPVSHQPVVDTELELWKLEREALLK